MLYAAIVHAVRARKHVKPLWLTRLKWHTTVSIESTVSTTIDTFQLRRLQICMLAGSPALLWKPESVSTTD